MLDPQENITIGNFLYLLGLSIGVRAGATAPAAAVNLLQQTSYDKPLGDVMLGFASVTRLIEFKRKGNHEKERAKLKLLSEAIANLPTRTSTSREIHWYVETASDEEDLKFEARPYLDMFGTKSSFESMGGFVDSLVSEALSPRSKVSAPMVNEYIHDVLLTWRTGRVRRSATGLLVVVSGRGELHYVVLEDIADLGRTRSECLRLQRERRAEIERRSEIAQSIGKAHSPQDLQAMGAETKAHERVADRSR